MRRRYLNNEAVDSAIILLDMENISTVNIPRYGKYSGLDKKWGDIKIGSLFIEIIIIFHILVNHKAQTCNQSHMSISGNGVQLKLLA